MKALYEDPDLLIIDKPAGVPSPTDDEGACHRLDTATSGLLVIAKNRETWLKMREAFSKNRIKKEYVALAQGQITGPGKIEWPIGPDPKSARRVKVYRNRAEARRNKAQEAVTTYWPLSPPHPDPLPQGERDSWIRVVIKTGRRHQIRAHLAAIGHPIVGDTLYKGPPACVAKASATAARRRPADRLCLHASRLKFTHPNTGAPIEVISVFQA